MSVTNDDCLPPFLNGLTSGQLQAFRAQLQQAIFTLQLGGQVVSASYAQGDGSKAITYRAGDLPGMQMTLRYIDVALGIPTRRRRAIAVRF